MSLILSETKEELGRWWLAKLLGCVGGGVVVLFGIPWGFDVVRVWMGVI